MNANLVGKTYPEVPFLVAPDRLAAFRRVFGHASGIPPTFMTAAEFLVFPEIMGDPELDLDIRRVLHGSQAYVHHRSLIEGETLTVRSRLASIRSKGGNGFLTIETDLIDAGGDVACSARSMMIERAESS